MASQVRPQEDRERPGGATPTAEYASSVPGRGLNVPPRPRPGPPDAACQVRARAGPGTPTPPVVPRVTGHDPYDVLPAGCSTTPPTAPLGMGLLRRMGFVRGR